MKVDKRKFKKVVKTEFDRQWREVVKNYPLVAAAFVMRKKEFARVVRERLPNIQELGSLFNPWIDERVAIRISVRLAACFRNFERAIGEAQNDGEARDAFEGLSQCLSRKSD
jgi:hypothetical protein